MYIPTHWRCASGEARGGKRGTTPVRAWGWGEDAASAESAAQARLSRMIERVERGEGFPERYAYEVERPPREEILRVLDAGADGGARAVLTRNRYGAQVLNTSRMLFLDIDIAEEAIGFIDFLRSLFKRRSKSGADSGLSTLRRTLARERGVGFRIYRTAQGLRVIATNRAYDPVAEETRRLMDATGTDVAFARLCRAQKSFRARLTPKPWRCACVQPPGRHPRDRDGTQTAFAGWLQDYEAVSARHATCAFVCVSGPDEIDPEFAPLIELHDELTGARSGRRLA